MESGETSPPRVNNKQHLTEQHTGRGGEGGGRRGGGRRSGKGGVLVWRSMRKKRRNEMKRISPVYYNLDLEYVVNEYNCIKRKVPSCNNQNYPVKS